MIWSIISFIQNHKKNKTLISTGMFQDFFCNKYDRFPTNEEWFQFSVIATKNNGYVNNETIHKIKNQTDLFNKFSN